MNERAVSESITWADVLKKKNFGAKNNFLKCFNRTVCINALANCTIDYQMLSTDYLKRQRCTKHGHQLLEQQNCNFSQDDANERQMNEKNHRNLEVGVNQTFLNQINGKCR